MGNSYTPAFAGAGSTTSATGSASPLSARSPTRTPTTRWSSWPSACGHRRRRASCWRCSAPTHVIYDRFGNVIAFCRRQTSKETDGSGPSGTTREYVWLTEAEIAPTVGSRTTVDRPLAVVDAVSTTPVTYYASVDHLNRPVLLTNASKASVWSAVWLPWGGVQATTGTVTLNERLPGQWFQAETGLHYNWHRHYDPTLGRYTQTDPLGFVDGPSVYGYGRGSPLAQIDPKGLMSGLPDWLKPGKPACRPCETTIYRAVNKDELNEIRRTNQFRNPPGIECKYFSKTLEGALLYAEMAHKAFSEKYYIVSAKVSCSLVDSLETVIVDINVPAICVPTVFLPQLIPITAGAF